MTTTIHGPYVQIGPNTQVHQSLMPNRSIPALLEMLGIIYTIKTGEREHHCHLPTPQESQPILVAPVSRVELGIWPESGPVEQICYSPHLDNLLADRTLSVVNLYDHARSGDPLVRLVLTHNTRRLKKLGLNQLLPGHNISLYLTPQRK